MASFASSATTGGARKHAWTKSKIMLLFSLKEFNRVIHFDPPDPFYPSLPYNVLNTTNIFLLVPGSLGQTLPGDSLLIAGGRQLGKQRRLVWWQRWCPMIS